MKAGRFSIIAVLCVAASVISGSAGAESAIASAQIVRQVSFAQDAGRDLKFGHIIPGVSGGSVVVSADDGRTSSGTVILGEGDATPSASFALSSDEGLTYGIILPASVTVSCGEDTLTVDHFTFNASNYAPTSQQISVGARLNFGACKTTSGNYTGVFPIMVNYN